MKLRSVIDDIVRKSIREITEADSVLGQTKPIPLSQIAAKKQGANAVVQGGQKDGDKADDSVSGGVTTMAVGQLKPAQTEIIVDKAISFALGYLNTGKPPLDDMEAIVSQDDYIMDGHHRWAARFLIDPNASVKVTRINLPGPALVTALNLVTVGKLGIQKGNTGNGNVADFTGAKIGAALDTAMTNGSPMWPKQDAEKVKEALGKVPGANGDPEMGKQLMMKNADSLPKQIMPGAPPRVEMPVIDGKKVAIVQKLMQNGMIDIEAPFTDTVKQSFNLQ